jgi:hypothetical protein
MLSGEAGVKLEKGQKDENSSNFRPNFDPPAETPKNPKNRLFSEKVNFRVQKLSRKTRR